LNSNTVCKRRVIRREPHADVLWLGQRVQDERRGCVDFSPDRDPPQAKWAVSTCPRPGLSGRQSISGDLWGQHPHKSPQIGVRPARNSKARAPSLNSKGAEPCRVVLMVLLVVGRLAFLLDAEARAGSRPACRGARSTELVLRHPTPTSEPGGARRPAAGRSCARRRSPPTGFAPPTSTSRISRRCASAITVKTCCGPEPCPHRVSTSECVNRR
jgi:hypothetical protein